MGKCGCKADNAIKASVSNNEGLFQKIVKNVIKVIGFLISLIFLPFIMAIVVWFMFDMIVLNQNIDLGKILNYVIGKAKRFNQEDDEDYEDDELEDLTEDDVTLLNAEDITEKRD
jgi:hypothetical protein